MAFRSEDIDQPQMFQAWQIFIEKQRNVMFQEFQKISDKKDMMIAQLNEKNNDSFEILKHKQEKCKEFEVRQFEIQDDICNITTKNIELKKEIVRER